jgi:hypothetical protein
VKFLIAGALLFLNVGSAMAEGKYEEFFNCACKPRGGNHKKAIFVVQGYTCDDQGLRKRAPVPYAEARGKEACEALLGQCGEPRECPEPAGDDDGSGSFTGGDEG